MDGQLTRDPEEAARFCSFERQSEAAAGDRKDSDGRPSAQIAAFLQPVLARRAPNTEPSTGNGEPDFSDGSRHNDKQIDRLRRNCNRSRAAT